MKTLGLEPVTVGVKCRGGFQAQLLGTLFFSLTLVGLFPVVLAAQASSSTGQATAQVVVYGGGFQTPLLFNGESVPANEVSLGVGVQGLYDDNVLASNSHRVGDEAVAFTPGLTISRHSDRLITSFDYTPFFMLYRRIDGLDRVNHFADLNASYQLSSRIVLGVHEGVSYQNGNYPALSQAPLMSGLPPATLPTQQILAYTTRDLTNAAGLDLTIVTSGRTRVTLAGGQNLVKYGNQTAGQPLYNGNGYNGSLMFEYRMTAHTSLGTYLVYQDTTYEGGQVFGNRLRSQVESAYLSLGTRLSPSVSVTLFGGPQYIGAVGYALTPASVSAHFQGSGGGSISKSVRNTALDATFQRAVAGSGGLYTSVINTNANFGVRRRLGGKFESTLHVGIAREDASLFEFANGKTDGVYAGIDISRPLSHGAVFHATYDSWHQVSKGTLPIVVNFDRNQVAVGIQYRLKSHPLAR
jgi:hypothetical protein